tara:strand:+ start:53 stop:256 length:204 start_codon:yes stop_codon:yes gene_type:complete
MATFTKRQLELIADAVEDYAVLIDEDAADECGEILDIIEAELKQPPDDPQVSLYREIVNFYSNPLNS